MAKLEFVELPVVMWEEVSEDGDGEVLIELKQSDIVYKCLNKSIFYREDISIYEEDGFTIIQNGFGEDAWLLTVAMPLQSLMDLIGGKVLSLSYSL